MIIEGDDGTDVTFRPTVVSHTPGSIHFHNSDERFCGITEKHRQFTLDPNEVTCQGCMDHDTFVLTDSGRAAIAKAEP